MSPYFAHPLQHGLLAFSNAGIPDSHVLLKDTLFSHRRHAHALSIFLKLQAVSCPHAKPPSHVSRYGDLPLARHFRLFLHSGAPISLLYHRFLTFQTPPIREGSSLPNFKLSLSSFQNPAPPKSLDRSLFLC